MLKQLESSNGVPVKLTFYLAAFLVLMVLVWGVFAQVRTTLIERKVEENRAFSGTYTELINLLALTQEMRRREKDFFLRKDIMYARQYENLTAEASSHLAEIKKEGAFLDELNSMDDLLKKHRQEFLQAVATQEAIGFDLDKGIQGRMRDHIHALEDILDYKIKNDKLTLMLSTIRRNEKNFLLKMQSEPDQPTPEVAKEMESALKASSIKQEVKTEALDALNKYLVEFRALVAKENALQKSTAALTSMFTQFERTHYKLLNQTRTSARESDASLVAFVQRSRHLALVWSIVTLAGALAVLIGLWRVLQGRATLSNRSSQIPR